MGPRRPGLCRRTAAMPPVHTCSRSLLFGVYCSTRLRRCSDTYMRPLTRARPALVREIKNGLYKEYTETTAVIYCSRQAGVALYGQKILTGAVLLPD